MGCFLLNARESARVRIRLTMRTLAWIVLLAPPVVHGQCPPLADAGKSQNADARSPAGKPAPTEPQFYDEPRFTVAGVTDPTNLGGHGSDTVVRTKEALAKDAAALGKDAASAPAPASVDSRGAYERARSDADAGQYDRARASVR